MLFRSRRPTIYCDTSTLPAVINALAQFRLLFMRDVDWWQAQYDGVASLVPYYGVTPVGKQYLDPGPFDVSITNGVWPGAAAPAPPPPPPASYIPGVDDMDTIAIAPRPTSITPTPTDDVFSLGKDGKLYFQVNSPYWVAGNPVLFDPQPIAPFRVGASWASDNSALRVFVLVVNPDLVSGTLYVNAAVPGVWKFGGWDPVVTGVALPK